MSIEELKNLLIARIKVIDNRILLEALHRLLELEGLKSNVYVLSGAQRNAINEGRAAGEKEIRCLGYSSVSGSLYFWGGLLRCCFTVLKRPTKAVCFRAFHAARHTFATNDPFEWHSD